MVNSDQSSLIKLEIMSQPDETTCGPTSLHAVYKFFNDDIELKQVIKEVHRFDEGGTLAVWLGCHALQRGYEAHLYTANLQLFDPTWFKSKKVSLRKKLIAQLQVKTERRLVRASHALLDFLKYGGKVFLEDFTRDLIRKHLTHGFPILTGLSSTYLYRSAREYGDSMSDDVRGEPEGHFVILCGYDRETKNVLIADPHEQNPYSPTKKYEVHIDRVICAILLGILTHDANFLIIYPKKKKRKKKSPS